MAAPGAIAKQRKRLQRRKGRRRGANPSDPAATDAPAMDDDDAPGAPGAAADTPLADPDGAFTLDDISRALAQPGLSKKEKARLSQLYRRAFKRERAQAREALKQDALDVKRFKIEQGVPFLQDKIASLQARRDELEGALGIGVDGLEGAYAGQQLTAGGEFGGAPASLQGATDAAGLDFGGGDVTDLLLDEQRVEGASSLAERFGLPGWSLWVAGGLLLAGGAYFMLRRKG